MNEVYDFSDLRLGMRINIEGTRASDGTFTALQISIKDDGDEDVIEACIDSVDPATGVVRILGLAVHVSGDLEIKDVDKRPLPVEALQRGMRVKAKGRLLGDGSFAPLKIKLKPDAAADVVEIEGEISDLDPHARSLRVMGFHVVCDSDIEIEA